MGWFGSSSLTRWIFTRSQQENRQSILAFSAPVARSTSFQRISPGSSCGSRQQWLRLEEVVVRDVERADAKRDAILASPQGCRDAVSGLPRLVTHPASMPRAL
jgi:hypothetical protein